MHTYALVTGASKGIGRSIACSLARRGFNLLLVARSEAELLKVQDLIGTQFGVKVHILAMDLSVPGAAFQIADWVIQNQFPLSALINNAGYGLFGKFNTLPLAEQMNMLQLNINFLVELTHLLIPILQQQKGAYILNIASTAAYQAVPLLGVYSASKAFVLSFSRALCFELAKSKISVTCLCPGPVDTGFADRAGLSALKKVAAMFNMQPDGVAEFGVRGMLNRKSEIIPGINNKISAFASRILPKIVLEKAAATIYKA